MTPEYPQRWCLPAVLRRNVITTVPAGYAGHGRAVYPGFVQLSGFMSMNLDRHIRAQCAMFAHLLRGDGDLSAKQRAFYDEYLAVMDLTAEFYLQTLETVFVSHLLPRALMQTRGRRVDLAAIHRPALLTIEGENDDVTGRGQCRAAQTLCGNVPARRKLHIECPGAGHYGIFNGARFRTLIAPRIAQFLRQAAAGHDRVQMTHVAAHQPSATSGRSRAAALSTRSPPAGQGPRAATLHSASSAAARRAPAAGGCALAAREASRHGAPRPRDSLHLYGAPSRGCAAFRR